MKSVSSYLEILLSVQIYLCLVALNCVSIRAELTLQVRFPQYQHATQQPVYWEFVSLWVFPPKLDAATQTQFRSSIILGNYLKIFCAVA